MTTNTNDGTTRTTVSDRVDTIGWGLLLVVVGTVSLMPALPDGAWLIAAGVVMLGSSAVRASMQLRVHAITVVVGIVTLAAGLFTVAGFTSEVGPLVLIVLGLTLVVGALLRTRRTDAALPAPTHQGG